MHLTGPKQVYGDLVSNGKNNSLLHVFRSSLSKVCGFQSRGDAFFRAHHHFSVLTIPQKVLDVNFFWKKSTSFRILSLFRGFCQANSSKKVTRCRKIGKLSLKFGIVYAFSHFLQILSSQKMENYNNQRGSSSISTNASTSVVGTWQA